MSGLGRMVYPAGTEIPKYNSLKDPFCVFTQKPQFRKHFTDMVGSHAIELLDCSKPTMPTRAESLLPTRKQPDLAALPTFELPLTKLGNARTKWASVDPAPETDEGDLRHARGAVTKL